MAGEGRDGAAVSLLGYRVGGGRDSHTKLGIKTRWSATVGRRSRKLGFDSVGGVNYSDLTILDPTTATSMKTSLKDRLRILLNFFAIIPIRPVIKKK